MQFHPLGSSPLNRWRVSKTMADLVRPHPGHRGADLSAEPQAIRIDLNRTACIVVDMQNDFCHPDGWLASIGVDITPARAPIEPLTRLLPALRGAGIPVIWLNWGNRPDQLNLSPSLIHVYNPDGESAGLGARLPKTNAAVLEKDSWGAALVEPLVAEPADIRVDKYRMSGFWDTPLDSILRNLAVTTLLFAGVNLDQCVLCTLQDANFLGYDCILIDDCSGTTSPEYCVSATRYNIKQIFGFITRAEAISAAIGGAG